MPDQKFLQELENHVFTPWDPKQAELKAKNQDEEIINDSLEARSKEEAGWTWAASRWNLLTEPVSDPRVSNVLLPFIRMIGATAISALSEAHRKNIYKPRQRSDDAKGMLWQGASDHIDNETGMQDELDDFYSNFVVLGNSGLEDYVTLPYINRRFKTNGEWDHKAVRDFSRPKIGTRSRSPWTFGFWTGNKNPNEDTPIFWRDFYSYNVFIQELANVYLPDNTPKYINCDCVKPGADCFITEANTVGYEPMDHQGVSVITFQDPVRDICRKYANGVLILDMALHDYIRTQKTTLAIATYHHKFDTNLREKSGYGYGDSHLLRGLDALYQAIGNLNIDNYKLANTNLISIRGQNGATAIDEDFDYLSGVRVEGDVIVSPMGTVRLGEFQQFKVMIDEWAKWTTKQSFDQLSAENRSGTAFELQQQIKAASQGNQHTMTKLAGGCFRKHAKNRLSFILSDMTVEEYKELEEAEIPMIQELITKNKASKDDYTWEQGRPTSTKIRQKVNVKNRKLTYDLGSKGEYTIDGLRDEGQSESDSEIPVVPEFFWPVEYIESGAIPDIEVEVDLGAEKDLQFQKVQFLANYARQRIAEAASNPQVTQLQTRFDGRKIDDEVVRSVGDINKESVMVSEGHDEEMEKTDDTIEEIENILSPTSNAQLPQPPVSLQNIDAGGFGSLGEQPNPAQNPVNAATAGAAGVA